MDVRGFMVVSAWIGLSRIFPAHTTIALLGGVSGSCVVVRADSIRVNSRMSVPEEMDDTGGDTDTAPQPQLHFCKVHSS